MMRTTAQDFSKAYSIMYGPANESPAQLIKRLNSQDLKATFRKQALLNHPDRAAINSENAELCDLKFKQINWAYQILKEALNDQTAITDKTTVYAQPAAPRQAPTYNHSYTNYAKPEQSADDHYWCGAVPRQKLPFGQFLYYSGRISWNTLLQALDWQETQRPKFGQIAMEGQLLSPGALSRLLTHRYHGEKIGDAAMRLGYLSPRMKEAVLNIQKHRQPAIGQYFVSNGLLGQEELGHWLVSQRQHNNMVC